MVKIRKLREDEFIELMRVIYENFPDRSNPNLFLNLYEIYPEGFLVAVDRDEIVGFAIGVMTSEDRGKILLIGVKKDYRKRGIGTLLLKNIILQLTIRGAEEVELEVRVSNKIAIKFYEKNGFIKKDRIENYYEDGEDAYIMVKRL